MFADILISTAAQVQADIPRHFLPTIGLQRDFLAPVPLASWVQGEAGILKFIGKLVFSQGLVHAERQTVVRAAARSGAGRCWPTQRAIRRCNLRGCRRGFGRRADARRALAKRKPR